LKIETFLILLFSLMVWGAQSQNFPSKGVPYLVNYSPQNYLNAGKIWDIESAPNGIVYMATDRGLLEYDGLKWILLHGSRGITRSVLVQNDSVIFTGSDLDFGQWTRDKKGEFIYKSLFPFKKNVKDGIEEFWHIYRIDGNLAFVSAFNIYILSNGQLTKIQTPHRIVHSYFYNNDLIVFDKSKQLWIFDNLKFIPQQLPQNFKLPNFKGAYLTDDKMCYITESSGIISICKSSISKEESPLSNYLKGAKVFSFEPVGKDYFAIGTVLKGLIIADLKGNIIHIINRYKGLQNNTVLSLHYAENGKLWAGLDYGLSYLLLKNNFTYVFDYRGDFGTAYSSFLKADDFYLGTNQGLYHCRWSELNNNQDFFTFNLIPNSEGQVWKIFGYGNEILVGHDRGLFILSNNKLVKLDSKDGVWDLVFKNNFLFAGTYNGISIYKLEKSGWRFLKKMEYISGSCKQLAFDSEQNLWVNIPNFALVKVKLDSKLNPIERKVAFEYDSSISYLNVDILKNNILLHGNTANKTYYYNGSRFIKRNNLTPDLSIKSPSNGFNSSAILNNSYMFYPVNNGFALYWRGNSISNSISNPLIKHVEAFNADTSIALSFGDLIPFKQNNLRFDFVVPNCENIYYQYRLHQEDEWSLPTQKTTIDFFSLESGQYNFQVRSANSEGTSKPVTFSFKIRNPWYQSFQFYFFIVLIFSLLAIFFYMRHRRALAKQRKQLMLSEQKKIQELDEKHQKTIVEFEQVKLKNENEKLREQLRSKTVELAIKARDNESKNRLLTEIKEKLSEIREDPRMAVQRLKEFTRMVDNNILNDDHTFEIQIYELHQEFFRKLKMMYPTLSGNDLKICAYLKVGLNSKEIADIMNIQLSSSYITRSRIRKKLNLDAEENLYDFLNSI